MMMAIRKLVLLATLASAALIAVPSLGQENAKTAPKTKVAAAISWPKSVFLDNGNALIFQPQVESWDGNSKIVAWSAVSYLAGAPGQKPALGTIKVEADTRVALEERLVNFAPVRITEFNFPTLSREQAQALSTQLQASFVQDERTVELDRVIAAVDKSQINPKAHGSNGLNSDPPKIYYSSTPTIFVNFDGPPIWASIANTDLKFAVNTNWDVFQHVPTKAFYLRYNSLWLQTSEITGTWTPTNNLPDSFSKLPVDDNWKDTRASVPSKGFGKTPTPLVRVSYEPAEMIATDGSPKYVPVPRTSLLWVSNTESDVFRAGAEGLFYYLVAGRWFSAQSLGGPWKFATPELPEDFKRISAEHPRSRVLASVPGTDQAAQAIVLASIPQTARVNIREIKAPDVKYRGGTPDFKPIEGTTLMRVVNTDKDIVKFGYTFYMCHQGVWFQAGDAAGPWEVSRKIPDEIYKIPPSDPLYHVTFVKIQEDTDPTDEWITLEAESGYEGEMVAWGTAVWGTGWYYPPYWYDDWYPWYGWYPPTYGFAAWYNPVTGTYGRGAAIYGPYGGAGAFAAYNPTTGTYARGAAAYGPGGGTRSFVQAWNPRTGTYAQTRQGSSVYGNWGSSLVKRGDDWARTGHITNEGKGTRTSGIKTDQGGLLTRKGPDGRTTIAKGANGDIYAGHDGNVYRKQNGEWQKWENGGWNDVPSAEPRNNKRGDNQRPQPKADKGTMDQLNRDNKKRLEGERRARESRSYDWNRGGRSSSGSFGGFRGGGGGFRGGGGRRR